MKLRICKRRFLPPGRVRAVLPLAWLALLVPQAVSAESLHPWLDRRVAIFVGAVDFDVDATIAKWTEGEEIDYIDLARLGVPESDTDIWARLSARLGERWQLSMDYFTIDVAGGRQVNFDFEFGDLVVPVGASMDASLDVDFYVLSMSYAFYRSDRLELGAGGASKAWTWNTTCSPRPASDRWRERWARKTTSSWRRCPTQPCMRPTRSARGSSARSRPAGSA